MTDTSSKRRVTAADIAREVGVSRATVGFVLNATPGQTISEPTRQRVLQAADRLGYRPHLAAQALASGRNRIILLVLPDWPFDYSMRRHIEEATSALDQSGYSLVTVTQHDGARARPLWETLQPDVVMGMVPFTPAQVEEIHASGVATVIPNVPGTPYAATAAFSDGPRLQVEHLIERGHRLIAFAGSPDPRLTKLVEGRWRLAETTARSFGLPSLDSSDMRSGTAEATVAAWHEAGVTAVAAYNDDVAALVARAALRLGLNVPSEMAIVGHDDSPLSQLFVPSLSTIHIDIEGLGRYFADLALSAAIGSAAPLISPVSQAALIVRESS